MQSIIREYRPEDRSALVRLMEELQDHEIAMDTMKIRRRLPEYGEYYTTKLLKAIEEQNGIVYVAEVDGVVAGCIAGVIWGQTKEEILGSLPLKTGRIRELQLSDGYRGQGIGKALMETIEKYFRDHKCDVSRTEVLCDNTHAYEFYHKLGYQDRYADVVKRL